MSFTIRLENLPPWVTANDIKGWLAAEDLVADSIKVICYRTGESKGFALMDAHTAHDMHSIIRRFDRAPLEGRRLAAKPVPYSTSPNASNSDAGQDRSPTVGRTAQPTMRLKHREETSDTKQSSIAEKRSMPDWARWLLVLPAALVADVGIQIVMAFLLSLDAAQQLFPAQHDRFIQLVNNALGSYCLIVCGASVAPSHKLLCGISLALVNAVLMTATVMSEIGRNPSWTLILEATLGLISSIIACERVRKGEVR